MTHRFLHVCALVAVLSWLLIACGVRDACAEVGVVQACSCGASEGARVCMAERTWGGCDCSGAIALPNPVAGVDAGGGIGGISGIGGSGGVSGSGGIGGGGIGGGGIGGGGIGGIGGGGIGGGSIAPYGACTDATDCVPDATCLTTTIAPDSWTVCAPKCQVTSDCPRGDGAYAAVARCNSGQCGLDCTPPFLQPLLSCPTNMDCIVLQAGAAYCHDADGL